jgi:ferrous iron transport protein A
MSIRLDSLAPGAEGTVVQLHGEGPVAQRLAEMGFVAGCAFQVIRLAPLGDPMEIAIDGDHLSLRRSEAHLVEVC